jgi:gentisate 1,2-dioxygenase
VRHDWGPEDIVVIPVNTVHQHFNADPNRTAVFVAFQSRMYHYLGHGGYEHLEDASQ